MRHSQDTLGSADLVERDKSKSSMSNSTGVILTHTHPSQCRPGAAKALAVALLVGKSTYLGDIYIYQRTKTLEILSQNICRPDFSQTAHMLRRSLHTAHKSTMALITQTARSAGSRASGFALSQSGPRLWLMTDQQAPHTR